VENSRLKSAFLSGGRSLPVWFRQELPDPAALVRMRTLLRDTGLRTVCTGAHCPNLGQCWEKGHATFMILGNTCTRSCRFCAVSSNGPLLPPDQNEPVQVARAVKQLGLRYVVITSVTRDDLPDEGANHFARVVGNIRSLCPHVIVEVLIPDFSARRECLKVVAESGVHVIGHNIETVRRLSVTVRSRADHERSLQVLSLARCLAPQTVIKSGIMAGMGETDEEIFSAFDELKSAGCDMLTVGQYLSPGDIQRHVPVARFVSPDMFEVYRQEGLKRGFRAMTCGPLVRSSYLAEESYRSCQEGIKA
jgi:lipoic acid synthetase